MTFTELQKIIEDKFRASRLSDIANELNVSPQVVSNWKARDQVPYKYVKIIRKKIAKLDNPVINIPISPSIGLSKENSGKEDKEISIIELVSMIVNIIRNNLLIIIITPLIFCIGSYFHTKLFVSNVYESKSVILPHGPTISGSDLKKAAARYGLGIAKDQMSISSVELYPSIINSRRLAMDILDQSFYTDKYGESLSLLKILTYGKNKKNPEINKNVYHSIAIRKFFNMIKVRTNKKTPLVEIYVTSGEPEFCALVNWSIINTLDSLQKSFRLSQIKDKKLFIESRAADVEKELIFAEEKLKEFREQNRVILQSPTLLLEEARLEREIMLKMQLFTTLKTEYEMARIEEVEDTKMVQILDEPNVPIRRISPNTKNRVILAGFLGIIFGFLIPLSKDWFKKNQDQLFYILKK